MSFQHRITNLRACFAIGNNNDVASLGFTLSAFDPETEAKTLEYDLENLGYEFGNCRLLPVTGEIEWVEVSLTSEGEVQRVSFTD